MRCYKSTVILFNKINFSFNLYSIYSPYVVHADVPVHIRHRFVMICFSELIASENNVILACPLCCASIEWHKICIMKDELMNEWKNRRKLKRNNFPYLYFVYFFAIIQSGYVAVDGSVVQFSIFCKEQRKSKGAETIYAFHFNFNVSRKKGYGIV